MSGYIGILPPDVRLSQEISASSKIMYAELTSISNHSGEVKLTLDEVIDSLSSLHAIHKKTVRRSVLSLASNGFITVNGAVVTLGKLATPTAVVDDVAGVEETKEVLKVWNNYYSTTLGSTQATFDNYKKLINNRLNVFTLEDIKNAMKARYEQTQDNEWFKLNPKHMVNLEILLKSDVDLGKYVEMPSTSTDDNIRSFNNTISNPTLLD